MVACEAGKVHSFSGVAKEPLQRKKDRLSYEFLSNPKATEMEKQNKIKFSISLTPECYDILTEFVEVTGSTKSGFISQVIEEQKEVLKELTKTVKKANKSATEKVSLLDT